ncbi:hypothetical protein B0H14DRAFT_2650633 [Mycena olivaceomarginata]|nr:hypothetical protein B0H14DRAFT_2650633 [Mycena olivaceomarginata]
MAGLPDVLKIPDRPEKLSVPSPDLLVSKLLNFELPDYLSEVYPTVATFNVFEIPVLPAVVGLWGGTGVHKVTSDGVWACGFSTQGAKGVEIYIDVSDDESSSEDSLRDEEMPDTPPIAPVLSNKSSAVPPPATHKFSFSTPEWITESEVGAQVA